MGARAWCIICRCLFLTERMSVRFGPRQGSADVGWPRYSRLVQMFVPRSWASSGKSSQKNGVADIVTGIFELLVQSTYGCILGSNDVLGDGTWLSALAVVLANAATPSEKDESMLDKSKLNFGRLPFIDGRNAKLLSRRLEMESPFE
jgi:hypothetical protein